MKKFYSIIAIAAMATVANAQILSANFNDVTGTGGNDGSWSGSVAGTALSSYANGGDWTLTKVYAGNNCLKVGTGSALGSVTTPALTGLNGNATLTFDAGAWNGSSESTTLNVSISGGGTLSASTVTLVKGSFSSYTLTITGGTSASQITFSGQSASNSRFFLDNVVVTSTVLGVADYNTVKKNLFVKNTQVSDEINFGAKADVKIYNMNSQVVKTASVTENRALNVQDLNAGMYIVTGTLNGQPVSQKIIKK